MLLIIIQDAIDYLKENAQEEHGYFSIHFLKTKFTDFIEIMIKSVNKWIKNEQNHSFESEPIVHNSVDWEYFATKEYEPVKQLGLNFVKFIDTEFIPLSLVWSIYTFLK